MPRGRPAGWKKALLLAGEPQAEKALASLSEVIEAEKPLPAYLREHPEMLTGDALRALAHKHGIARSEAAKMSDEKIRLQLKYAIYRRYEDELV
jgi:hypothetical protein